MPERDINGRFIKGNSGGPGRPTKERSGRYYEIMMTACSYEDWRKIVKKAAQQAGRGDANARKFLVDYLIGPPVKRMEYSGLDGAPIETNVNVTGINAGFAEIVELFRTARERAGSGNPPPDNE